MESTLTVPAGEAHSVALSTGDSARLHQWKGRILRGIPADHADHYRRLFDDGLVAALVERGLLVRSWIAPIRLDGFELVVEHERIECATYPREWTFGMLRDAALLVLQINDVASGFGYQTKDCHGYNILFSRGAPVYVDLGSFTPAPRGNRTLRSYEEFLRSYEYPLRLWTSCGSELGRRSVPRVGSLIPASTYAKIRWPVLRMFGDATLSRWIGRVHSARTLSLRDEAELGRRFTGWRGRAVRWLRESDLVSAPARIESIRRRVQELRPPNERSAWSDYHDTVDAQALTPRFRHALDRIRSLGATSVLEIAGNQGVLSRALASSGRIRVLCTDADAAALDQGRRAAQRVDSNLDWAILDPFRQETSPREAPPTERFRSDAVVALALTHHLLLTQGLDLREVLSVLGSFADRFVLIEFMPRGLWDGSAEPSVPDWYTEAWFRAEFERCFELLECTPLEPNRTLFVGRVRSAAP
ncbi:MAG: hypothetical protein FJ253_11220 [Phycisphaerae bacterium]|nr:hypothetical protein [Phycisphaerae bacterium]